MSLLSVFLFQIDKKIVRTEIGVLLRLSHPNIVSVITIEVFTGMLLIKASDVINSHIKAFMSGTSLWVSPRLAVVMAAADFNTSLLFHDRFSWRRFLRRTLTLLWFWSWSLEGSCLTGTLVFTQLEPSHDNYSKCPHWTLVGHTSGINAPWCEFGFWDPLCLMNCNSEPLGNKILFRILYLFICRIQTFNFMCDSKQVLHPTV